MKLFKAMSFALLAFIIAIPLYLPVTAFIADRLFDGYMEEYNIPKEDIASRKAANHIMYSGPQVTVEYKSDPEYKYVYHYKSGNYFDIHPKCVFIYKGKYKSIMIDGSDYNKIKYPPVTQKQNRQSVE